jgi:hypothetical protein
VVNGLMLAQKLKQDAQAKDAVSSLPSPLMDEAPLNVTDNPQIGKRASQLVSAAKALQKYTGADVQAKEEAQAQKANELALKAQDREAAKDAKVKARIKEQETRAKAKAEATKAKEDAKLELAKVKAAAAAVKQAQRRPSAASLSSASSGVTADVPAPKKITKANGKVEADAPALSIPYEPLAEEYLYPKGISPKEYAKREAASKGKAGNAVYEGKAEASERRRQGIASDLKAKHPTAARAIDWLQRELQRVGVNPHDVERAIKHAQDNVTDDVASALEAFKK